MGSVGLRGDDGGGASFSVLAVFLLVMCSYTLVALESAYRDDVGCGEPSLERAEEVLEAFLSATLEIAMGEALPVAAMTPSAGPVETLDAVLLSLLREGMPSSAGGWHVELVEARCRQSAGAPGDRTLVAELIADLGDPDAGPSVRMGMSVSLPSSSWAELASRASSVVAGLEGGDGPVSQGGSGLLWSVAQERAFAGVDEVRDLLTSSDVEVALSSSLMALGRGEVPFHVPPPPVALGEL
ncbi:MAG: hypothetical protein GWN18_06250, partial [Thermoplasmata archaeon]|nr:hypothetical protein [Thermoplasmata archaeon]NIS11672.1 hypothetical protein [Thermoplasmata archaeon]NIS19571.1 hypothetical protein [Thermoplasmata archaeon]NIT76724.1 hypothetical protein [Thermoplasmata archaeon]NIU48684.1 hypothetical protein [Thermoplasmata archaeon]